MKKFKLFTTIASLCLAVALMAFGVYAATKVELGVTGTIQFTSTGIDGSWSWDFTKATAANNEDYSLTKGGTGAENTLAIKVNKVTTNGETHSETSQTYTFTITGTFTNTSTTVATLSVAEDKQAGKTYKCSVTTITTGDVNSSGSAAAKNGSMNGEGKVAITISFTIDPTQTIDDNTDAFSIKFSAVPTNAA